MFGFLKKNDGKVINVNDIDRVIGKEKIIDIREPFEYSRGSIKTAKNIPMSTLLSSPEKYLKKNEEYYILCQSGGRSSKACSNLKDLGFDVVNVSGGMGSYLGNNRK